MQEPQSEASEITKAVNQGQGEKRKLNTDQESSSGSTSDSEEASDTVPPAAKKQKLGES